MNACVGRICINDEDCLPADVDVRKSLWEEPKMIRK